MWLVLESGLPIKSLSNRNKLNKSLKKASHVRLMCVGDRMR